MNTTRFRRALVLLAIALVLAPRPVPCQGSGGTFGRSKPPKEQVPMIVVNVP